MPKNYEGFITCSARQKYFLLVSIFLTFLTLVFMKTQCVGDKLLLFVFIHIRQAGKWIQIDFPQSDLFAVCVYIRQAG